jgi:hypothetical protein
MSRDLALGAPSPANPNSSNNGMNRSNGMMSNIILGNAAFNNGQNGYASVSNIKKAAGLEGVESSVGPN